jgi:ketosteroid isomerase-like protein
VFANFVSQVPSIADMRENSMRICMRFGIILLLIDGVLRVGQIAASLTQENRSAPQDRVAIERLHQQDVQATLSGEADDSATLWDKDAVRLLPGSPAEIGKAVIYATDKREETAGEGQSVCYKPEITDLQIAGDWAFEWGYFSYKQSANAKPGRGKVLRVIKRQPDGSWKFARVIGFTEKLESAAPVSDPCK